MNVGMMGHPPSRAVIQRQRQCALAYDPNGCELDGDAGFAIVGVGQEQEILSDVVTSNPNVAGQLGQDPNPFPKAPAVW